MEAEELRKKLKAWGFSWAVDLRLQSKRITENKRTITKHLRKEAEYNLWKENEYDNQLQKGILTGIQICFGDRLL